MKFDFKILNEVTGEVPTGSGVDFTLAHDPGCNSLKIFKGGARQTLNVDYTIIGNALTLATGLGMGEALLADYSYETI